MSLPNDDEFLRLTDSELTELYEGVETHPLLTDLPEGLGNTVAEIGIPTVCGIVILSKTNDERWVVVIPQARETELSVSDALAAAAQLRDAAARAENLNIHEAEASL